MAVSKNLLLAILSLDSYNRGYGEGIPDLGGFGSKIGSATLLNDSETAESTKDTAQAAGFYAAAYDAGNEIVISYRGTDGLNDIWNGWTSIVGAASSQAELAAKFYHSVKADNPGKEIILTGHSLGGALAGFVGSLFGEEAVLFNNISFEAQSSGVHADASITDAQIEAVGLYDPAQALLLESTRTAARNSYYNGRRGRLAA